MATPHELLGLPRSATHAEIKRRFRELSSKAHPDKGGDAETFHALKTAYDQALALPEVPHCETCGGSREVEDSYEKKGFVFAFKKPCPTCRPKK